MVNNASQSAREVRQRHAPSGVVDALKSSGIHPLLARLFASRGVQSDRDVSEGLGDLLPPADMNNLHAAAERLARAIDRGERLLVVADFDADGATACAVALRGLRRFNATVDFLVPDRFAFGYGLTPALIDHALIEKKIQTPDLIITVDNGISSHEGVRHAKAAGIDVLITDHHLPGQTLPDALIVNPNLRDCPFPSKHLAGVGVMFYVLMALRALLRDERKWPAEKLPRLDDLLPIVALGTVADLVRLDANNRRLVAQGLARLRGGTSFAGLNALFSVAGQDVRRANPTMLGFSIGPRLNAAGRLSDMSIGIRCLIEDDPHNALALAQQLDDINRERQKIEGKARDEAIAHALNLMNEPGRFETANLFSLVLHSPNWHQGVIGLVASKIKERFHRPTIVFTQDTRPDQLKGSGRSIAGVHLRDVLERIDTTHPGMIITFGGHAMAAGLTLSQDKLSLFTELFEQTVREFATQEDLLQILEVDGPLEEEFIRLDVAAMLESMTWGQGFSPPVFTDEFLIFGQRRLKEKHLKLSLGYTKSALPQLKRLDAIWFNAPHDLGAKARLAYRLSTNTWQGISSLQLEVVAAL